MPPEWLRHAFAVEPKGASEPTGAERAIADRLCRQVVARELTTAALIFLESVRPLNFVAAQGMQFFAPLLHALGDIQAYDEFARFLEHRGSIDWLCQRIEELSRDRSSVD